MGITRIGKVGQAEEAFLGCRTDEGDTDDIRTVLRKSFNCLHKLRNVNTNIIQSH